MKPFCLFAISLSLFSGGFVRVDVSEPIASDISLMDQIDRAEDVVNRMLQTNAAPQSNGKRSIELVDRAALVELERELNALRAVAVSDLNGVGLQTLRARAFRARRFCAALTPAEGPPKPVGTSGANSRTTAEVGTARIAVDRAQLRQLDTLVEVIVRLASDT
jgi:hypothetical protein